MKLHLLVSGLLAMVGLVPVQAESATPSGTPEQPAPAPTQRPNIVFIVSDDHAASALGSGENDSPIPLPNFHKLADQGMVFDRSYCTNSLCGPSRACIITGRHSHMNGFLFNEDSQKPFDGSQPTFPQMLQKAGYQTALFGKWHLKSNPTGFDTWQIFPEQGNYYNPVFIVPDQNGQSTHEETVDGYATNIVTDKSIDWLEHRDKSKPFLLYVGHKAPHRPWTPPINYLGKVDVSKLTPPANLMDDYANRPEILKKNEQTIAKHMALYSDLKVIEDLVPTELRKQLLNPGYEWQLKELDRMKPAEREAWLKYYSKRTKDLVDGWNSGKLKDPKALTEWKWRAYMEDYLSCIKSVDENVGRLVEYLDKNGLSKNTLVVYVGDQSFFTGEHGLYDKRWIFEETLRMPLIMRWPGTIAAGVRSKAVVQNIDYAPTFMEITGNDTKENMDTFQGVSLTPLFKDGEIPMGWRSSIYYCFYENPGEHNCPRHDGIRTDRYTFARIWTSGEWMLFDNEKDPNQMKNVYGDPEYKDVVAELTELYNKAREQYKVPADCPGEAGTPIPRFEARWDSK
jgi:N-acetylglucosamine-6-sulfatase